MNFKKLIDYSFIFKWNYSQFFRKILANNLLLLRDNKTKNRPPQLLKSIEIGGVYNSYTPLPNL